MGKFVQNIDHFFDFCKENEVKFVDFRFTDLNGAWHSISYNIKAVTKENFTNGIPMDASSMNGWQPIDKSDMIMKQKRHLRFWTHLPLTSQSLFFAISTTFTKVKFMKNALARSQKERCNM